jgi:pyruvate-formate lyase
LVSEAMFWINSLMIACTTSETEKSISNGNIQQLLYVYSLEKLTIAKTKIMLI